MKRPRSPFAGDTDYTGFTLDEIREHFEDWRSNSQALIGALSGYSERVEAECTDPDEARNIIDFLGVMANFFDRATADFGRLLNETSSGVREAHLLLVEQLLTAAKRKDDFCVEFKREYLRGMRDERMRPLYDAIYADSRDGVIYLTDLGALRTRLETFVGVGGAPGEQQGEVLKLEPEFYGIGIRIKPLWRKLCQYMKRQLWRGSASRSR